MNVKVIVVLLLGFVYLFDAEEVRAQYLREFGFGGGLSGYTGEASNSPLKGIEYNVGIFYRSNINTRISVSLGLDYGILSGNTDNVANKYPPVQGFEPICFKTEFFAPEALIEVNFFPYPKMLSVLNSKSLTPYYFVGVNLLGYIHENAPQKVNCAIGIPFGLGAKYLFSEHWGVQVRLKAVKTFTDKLDDVQLSNPYNNDNGGLQLHLNDWLYTTTIMLTYSFGGDTWDCYCPKGNKRNKSRR